ncbi:MAG: ABC transporter permease [Lachnospiraceae bacterium]|nr:ABC transporter permease [Lachnospiraceae bacterium]
MMDKVLKAWQKIGMFVVLLILVVFFSLTSDKFMTTSNILNILRQVSVVGTAGVGVSFVMISGSTDLSVGSIVALCTVIIYKLVMAGVPVPIVCLIAILIAASCSVINGILANTLQTHPFALTLAMSNVWTGVAMLACGGVVLFGLSEKFTIIAKYQIFGAIPSLIPIFSFLAMIGIFVLSRSYFGRRVYALGGNPEAARLAGIDTKKMTILTHALAGAFYGAAAILYCARTATGDGMSGTSYAYDLITAANLGGITIGGGSGHAYGAILGLIVLQVLTNGLTLLGVSEFYQRIAKGLILIGALTIAMAQRKSANRTDKEIAMIKDKKDN